MEVGWRGGGLEEESRKRRWKWVGGGGFEEESRKRRWKWVGGGGGGV